MPSFWLGDPSINHPSARAIFTLRRGIVRMLSSNSAIDAHKVITMQFAETTTRTHAPRVLILGGTTEASELAAHLAPRSDVTVISSLAGRVSQPRLPAGIVREGGFGGVAGLI